MNTFTKATMLFACGTILFLTTNTHAATEVAVVGDSLSAARTAYINATSLKRVDCDPVGNGRWVCASFKNPTLADVGTTTTEPVEPPVVIIDPVEPPVVIIDPPRFAVLGASLLAARTAYINATSLKRVDCDPVGNGRWICASFKNPTLADIDGTAPTAPTTPPVTEPPVVINAKANITKIPANYENNFKFNPNGLSTLVSFTDNNGDVKQLTTFVRHPDRKMYITMRDFPSGEWSTPVSVHNAAMGNATWEYDSHNNTGVGVASDGTIFVTGNHHVDELRMAKSNQPWSITDGFTKVAPNSIPGNRTGRVTYPSFGYSNGDLFFSYRDQIAGQGNGRFAWIIVRWNVSTGKWDNFTTLNSGTSLRLYASNLAHAPDGTLHITGLFRDDRFHGGEGTIGQRDLFHLYSTDKGVSWKQYGLAGNVKLPLIWDEWGHNWDGGNYNPPGNLVEKLIWNTPRNGSGGDPVPNNAGSIATDSNGNPWILNDERGKGGWIHQYTGTEWKSWKAPFDNHSMTPISLGDGKMGAIVSRAFRLYFHSLNPNDASYKDGILLANEYVNAHNNASYDRIAFEHGWMSTVMMRAEHNKTGTRPKSNPQPAYVLSIPISDLATFATPFVK